MQEEIVGQLSIEPEMESYRSLWDDSWANELDAAATPSPILPQLILDLLMTWKAANHTHASPFILVNSLRAFYKGLAESQENEIDSLATQFVKGLEGRVPHISLTADQVRSLQLNLALVAGDISARNEKSLAECR